MVDDLSYIGILASGWQIRWGSACGKEPHGVLYNNVVYNDFHSHQIQQDLPSYCRP